MGEAADTCAKTKIGSGVYLGPYVVVTKGVTIGDRVAIGAMSFVNKSIPFGTTAFGIPARVMKQNK